MSYSMYLDSTNHKSSFDVAIKSYEEAVSCILQKGVPFFISFNSDLKMSEEKSCYDFAKWLVESAINQELLFPEDFSFHVHEGDAVGRNRIKALLNNYLHFNVIYTNDDLS